MKNKSTRYNRRSFLKVSATAGGGLVLGFTMFQTSCNTPTEEEFTALEMPDEWFEFNPYLKIGDNGVVTIYAPNAEFGQNVRTSMPMLVAEELDIDWKNVVVEQAMHAAKYGNQFTGGSRGINSRWDGLRKAGAAAKYMLKEAAAKAWQVPADEITTALGVLTHEASGKTATYGEMASAAAQIPAPEEDKLELKAVKDFKLIGRSQKNVDGRDIVTGKPMFGVDYRKEGMLYAAIEHPPAFGMKLKSFDASAAKAMSGIKDVFAINTYNEEQEKAYFDTNAFPELVAIVGNSTWEVMQAKKALKVEWEPFSTYTEQLNSFGNASTQTVPAGLESTTGHIAQMEAFDTKPGTVVRKDGDPETAFKNAAKIIERTYSAPYLAHNCMEPMNAFADYKDDKVYIAAPHQIPGFIEPTISKRLDIPPENIEIEMTRMGGGFGRRAYSHYMLEAALISKHVNAPIKLQYTREDDMTSGIYRPTYRAIYRAAFDENNNLTAIHIKAGGVPESPLFKDRFPAGAIDNYMAEEWSIPSNITTGAFRAPRSNFMAGAEQSFLDEVAEAMGKDPIDFRLELLKRAAENPVGEKNDYDAKRYAGVLKLVKEKSNWNNNDKSLNRGVAAYFCHSTYAAHVLDLTIENGKPVVQKVTSAIDCGVVVNPDAAVNMAEGGIVDGIGNALFGELTFKDGQPQKQNFNTYRMIRMSEAPKSIDVHFVQNDIHPTGMGEPPFPPIFGAIANAMYKATGKRKYQQPFYSDQLIG